MKTILLSKSDLPRLLCTLIFVVLLTINGFSQKGKDGAKTYNSAGLNILNRYTTLSLSASAGAPSIVVSDISQLSGAYAFTNSVNPYTTNALSVGDLIMIIQMQGADINTTDNSSYGAITAYNGAGNYELKTVFDISGNTIYVCGGLNNAYTQSGRSRIQVVRIPRLSDLTVGSSATLTGMNWEGTTGGIVALEVNGNLTLNGEISSNAIGFRGGVDDKNVSSWGEVVTLYRSTTSDKSASKGESIAGNLTDYNTLLNGEYGRGAPANGGGGGNGHNSGGGGGSNAGMNGLITPWNGTGIKNTSTATWASAWNLEAPGFATDISVGGGRGGYSFTYAEDYYPDPLTVAPGNTDWGGDFREIVGGFGGRALDYNGNTRLFLGGGGGAGDGNDGVSGDGGSGGGIAYLLINGNISGTGTVSANGESGHNTTDYNNDAAGGGGGGGAIVANVQGSIGNSIILQSLGGKGGDQEYIDYEAEGPGGGGGGGYIASSKAILSGWSVSAGTNGNSYSSMMEDFLPNGATQGASGTQIQFSFTDVASCSTVLPVHLISFTAILQDADVKLNWETTSEINSSYFAIEKSVDAKNFSEVAIVFATGNNAVTMRYSYSDPIGSNSPSTIYYRLKMVNTDNSYTYSEIKIIRTTQDNKTGQLAVYPNPVTDYVRVMLPAQWQNKQVSFAVYDMSGKLVKASVRNNAATIQSINLQTLSNGMYIIKVSTGTETAQQRIIKK